MSQTLTLPDLLDEPAIRESEAQAIMDRLHSGDALDPAILARARARSERATEAMRRKFGTINLAVDLIYQLRTQE